MPAYLNSKHQGRNYQIRIVEHDGTDVFFLVVMSKILFGILDGR